MAAASLKKRIRDTLRKAYFKRDDDYIHVSDDDSTGKTVHVAVISPRFRGKNLGEKHDLIWSVLQENLPPGDWGRVSLSVGRSPDELFKDIF